MKTQNLSISSQLLEKSETPWREQMRLAKEARTLGNQLRQGKQKSFRNTIGRI